MSNKKYNDNEFMANQDLLDFAVEQTISFLQNEGYTIEGANSKVGTYPNVVAKKADKLFGILVEGNEVRKQPKISISRKFDMLRFARKFEAIPLYASLGFGSANHEKFENEILLKNDPDGFYVNFTGFEEININGIPDIESKEYKEHVLNILGTCYELSNFKLLEKFLSSKCKWYSFFSGNQYKSKSEIMNYYNKKSKVFKNTEINYFLITFKGDWFTLNTSKVILPNGETDKNAKVMIPQPNEEPGIVVEQKKESGEKIGMAIVVGFNQDRLINDIYIGDPYAMNFIDYN